MSKSYSKVGRGSDKPAWIDDPGREKTNVLEAPFAADEVRRQLRCLPAYSVPGPDGVTYANWKRLDLAAELLSVILNICRKVARLPPSWKTSTTVLAYKNKGDEKDLKNWRPICLQNTIYKTYAATVAKRIANWAIEEEVINTAQKGFLPHEGCFEHTFLLRSCLEDARRRKRKIRVAWLDLENAFGSVPTNHLLGSMKELGLQGQHTTVSSQLVLGSAILLELHANQVRSRGPIREDAAGLHSLLKCLSLEQRQLR